MRFSGRLLLPLLVLLSCPTVASAFDGGAWTVSPGEWYSEVSGGRIYANGQFLSDTRNAAIPFEGRFQQFDLSSYNEIGWRKNLSLMLGLPFVTGSWRFLDETRTISGLSDALLGLRMRLRDDGPGLILDAAWEAPLGYNKNVFPAVGDGRHKVWGALHAGSRLPVVSGFVQAERGVFFVSEDGEVYSFTSVDAAAWISHHVLFGGRYADIVPLSSANEISLLGASHRAGPVLLVRVDDRLDISLSATKALFGRNSLEATRFEVALGFKQTKLNPSQGFLGTLKKP